MDSMDLESSLDRPPCSHCKVGRIRPIDIRDGRHLVLNCTNCRWSGRAELPRIEKKVIYLDTSTASHLVKACRYNNMESPWLRLYTALQQAAADETLCCAGSSILQEEAQLSQFRREIVSMSKAFGDPGLNLQLDVREAQLYRALDHFLAARKPVLERPPRQDAFEETVNQWLPLLRIDVEEGFSARRVDSIQTTKNKIHRSVTRIYNEYAENGYDFDEIKRREARGFGDGIISDGQRSIQGRQQLRSGIPNTGSIGDLATSFDLIIRQITIKEGLGIGEAYGRAITFLKSDHVRMTPIADLSGKLHAALAMAARGPTPRKQSPSDVYDVDHIATFMPYMDIFIVPCSR